MSWWRLRGCAALTAALLFAAAGCGDDRELTNREAIEAANEELVEHLPQVRPALDRLDIDVRDMNGRWRVSYGGGTGGAVVDVDKRSGRAEIVAIEQ